MISFMEVFGRLLMTLCVALAVGCAAPGQPVERDLGGGDDGAGDLAGADLAEADLAGADLSPPSCPVGFGDCNHTLIDGCETNLNTTANCGACGHVCQQVGGTNACVLQGAGYVCKPSCDATHDDCDGDPDNGCEADLTSAQHCGACNAKCENPHGTTVCSTQGAGWFCVPSCAAGWAACGAPQAGCTTRIDDDPDHCGGCGRSCALTNVQARTCSGGLCRPTCVSPWADCSRPAAPAADNGCETDGTSDPGESDNLCGGQSITVAENASVSRTDSRILPAGDTDTFTINLQEGSRFCVPGTGQSFSAKITLTPSVGTSLSLGYSNTCDNTSWQKLGNSICLSWGGTCGLDDPQTVYVQVSGVSGAQSCQSYQLAVQYCAEGTKCPGC